MRKSPRDRPGPGTGRSVYQIKVTLLHSRPPIWRRLQVESGVTLDRLHDTLQMVMGWTNSHLHGFRLPQPRQRGTRRRLLPIESADEKAKRLDELLRRLKDWLVYDYDFGDSWEHEVLLEEIRPRPPSTRLPMVLAGRGACPPEDIGGLPGYYHFLEAIKDPNHPEHEDMLEWAGKDFDPAAFDVQKVNRAFHGGWGPRRPDA
jgi:Plasmid pRiA4b ORF-3-like protein